MEQPRASLGSPGQRKFRLNLKGPDSRNEEAGIPGAGSLSSLALTTSHPLSQQAELSPQAH